MKQTLGFWFLGLLTIAGCGSKADPAAHTRGVRDKICACTSYDCARPVWKEYLKWMGESESGRAKASAEELAVVDAIMACAKQHGAM